VLHRIFLGLTLLADLAVLTGSLYLAWWIRFDSGWLAFVPPAPPIAPYVAKLPYAIVAWLLVMNYAGLYRRQSFVVGRGGTGALVAAAVVATGLVFALGFVYRGFSYSRLILALMGVQNVVLLRTARGLLTRAQVALRRRGVGVVRLAILGDGDEAKAVAASLARHPGYGFRLAGFVGTRRAGLAPHLGSADRLETILRRTRVDEVLFAPRPSVSRAAVMAWAARCQRAGVEVKMLADVFGFLTSRLQLEELFGMPIMSVTSSPLESRGNRCLKRAFDLAIGVPALVVLSPLLGLIALAVKLDSMGPVLYRQERVGRGGVPFGMLKFRSMRADAEKHTGPVWAKAGDPRRTRTGAFLRRTSLDELPQLLNVIAGEMSLVGPRPERPHFVKEFAKRVPRYTERHEVLPGITGWSQANGLRGDTPVEERTKYDLYYVENWSLWLDIRILFRTALEVFHHQEAY
jgi:exopolysaccharide biosynthesis polyprenyl glycosylphosphotransferase